MQLSKLFNSIDKPLENDSHQFSALPIPEYINYRIAKDKLENPVLLITSKTGGKFGIANLQLHNVKVLFDLNCKIKQGDNSFEKPLTVICFVGSDTTLKKYFLKLCTSLVENLGADPSLDKVRKEISKFIELFRLASEPQTKTVQGLWAELFLIAESKNPKTFLESWHTIPQEKFDFNNGEDRIEVKSTSTGVRIHNFSLDQLNSPMKTRTIIVSVFVRQASSGKNIETLKKEIVSHLIGEIELIDKLDVQIARTLGQSIEDAVRVNFDWYLAKESIRYYRSEDIPKINSETIPAFVTDVHFKSEITDVSPIKLEELNNLSEYFSKL